MSEFIALSCPSCGGQLSIQSDLQKFFCNHCGTELLLKQDHDGILTSIKARDLQASAKLKEIQFSVTAMELLKSRIAEVEKEIRKIRRTFLEYYSTAYAWSRLWNGNGPKNFTDYEKEKNLPTSLEWLLSNCPGGDWKDYIEKEEIPGYSSAEELIEFAQFVQRPAYKRDKYVTTILTILEPLPSLAEQLKQKKQQLDAMLEQAINQ
jgi:DNA-directed RNA polymerase subunit RPC12/RpoP